MSRIKYPTVEEIITTNKRVLEVYRAKKADKHELLGTKHQIQGIMEEVEIFKKIRYRDISEEELAKWIKNKKNK